MTNAWLFLLLAGLFEIGWPIGLKMAQTPDRFLLGLAISVVFLMISGWLLYLAQKQIPMGTAYAVWTGIGAAGTLLVGILIYGDPVGAARVLGVLLIIGGVATLKLAH